MTKLNEVTITYGQAVLREETYRELLHEKGVLLKTTHHLTNLLQCARDEADEERRDRQAAHAQAQDLQRQLDEERKSKEFHHGIARQLRNTVDELSEEYDVLHTEKQRAIKERDYIQNAHTELQAENERLERLLVIERRQKEDES